VPRITERLFPRYECSQKTRTFQSAVAFDTVTVSGVVQKASDSTALAGADVIITYSISQGGFQFITMADTGVTGANGAVAFDILFSQDATIRQIRWRVEAQGYQTESGTAQLTGDAIDLDTVRLTAYAADDSVDYVVSGRISGQGALPVTNATVIVTMTQGGSVIFTDTATANWQGYRVETTQPYDAADITVQVAVAADGYEPSTQSLTVASSTSTITVNVTLYTEGTGAAPAVQRLPAAAQAVTLRIFGLDGRQIGSFTGRNADADTYVRQAAQRFAGPMVVRMISGDAVIDRKITATAR